MIIFNIQGLKSCWEKKSDGSLMLAKILGDTWHVLNMQHISLSSKIWGYSDIPVAVFKMIKGPAQHIDVVFIFFQLLCWNPQTKQQKRLCQHNNTYNVSTINRKHPARIHILSCAAAKLHCIHIVWIWHCNNYDRKHIIPVQSMIFLKSFEQL